MANTFPRFSDGDVEIVLSKSDKYVLHSYVLALHSKWFKASLSERWQNRGSSLDPRVKQCWSYELCFDKDDSFATLMRRGTSSDAINGDTEVVSNSQLLVKSEVSQERSSVIKAHQDLFGTLYHVSPAFSHSSFKNAEQSILKLSSTAALYGCQHVVKPHVENHLSLYRTEVLDTCLDDPLAMLELALTVQSEWIFKEAATNLIGWDGERFSQAQGPLAELGMSKLMNRKRTEFVAKLRECEFALLRTQPDDENNSAGVLAVAFFRQWLVDRLSGESGSGLGNGYANVYRRIYKERIDDKLISRFLKAIGKSSKADEVIVELEIDILPEASIMIADILNDITRRKSDENDMSRDLTFMGVSDEELPWAKTS